MNLKRTVLLGVGCGAIAVWIAGAATSGSRPIAPPAVGRNRVAEASSAALASEISRLHERLRPTEVPIQSRDLFRYAPRGTKSPAAPVPQPPPTLAPTPAVLAAPLKLVGIAEDASQAGVVRTAILSGYGDLFLVKQGEAVTLRYRVSNILSDGVELVDLTDQTTLRLAIR